MRFALPVIILSLSFSLSPSPSLPLSLSLLNTMPTNWKEWFRLARRILYVVYAGFATFWLWDASKVRASYETEAVRIAGVQFLTDYPVSQQHFGKILDVQMDVPWQRSLLKSGPLSDLEMEVPMGVRYYVTGEKNIETLFLYVLPAPPGAVGYQVAGCAPESQFICQGS